MVLFEHYALHISGATSFKSLKSVGWVLYATFQEECSALGLLSDQKEKVKCLQELFAPSFEPLSIVFVTIFFFLKTFENGIRISKKHWKF